MANSKRRGPGEGSIYRVKGRGWAAVVSVSQGGQRRRRVRYAATYNEARRLLTAMRRSLDRGGIVPESRPTVKKYLGALAGLHPALSPPQHARQLRNTGPATCHSGPRPYAPR